MITTLRTGALALTSAQYKFGADKTLIIRLTASAAHKLYGDVNITLANVLAINIFQKDGAMIADYFNRTLKFTKISGTELEFSEVIDRGIAASETFSNLTNNGSAITATIANASFDLPAGTYNFLLLGSADSVFSGAKIQSQLLNVAKTEEDGVPRIFDQLGENDFLSINGLDLQFSYPARISLVNNNAGITNIPLVINAETLSKVLTIPSQKAKTGQENSSNSSPVVISSDQTSSAPAPRNSAGIIITPAQQKLFRCTFAKTQNGADSDFFTTIATGAGQGVTQASGNLLITSGATANSETILRSTSSFVGNTLSRIQTILSQRITNQTFFLELVDVIGDGLVANATSATTLVVTIPNNPFTALNVGQSMYVGALAGGLVGVPNRYTIASVSGNDVTFTVAGFSVTTGTCSLFGWNYYHTSYSGTGVNAAFYDAQRRGWNSGDTSITTQTTAAPGHMLLMGNEDGNSWVSDQLVASSVTSAITARGSRVLNLPDEFATLYFQIRCLNGSVAPASTTTLQIGIISVENYATIPTSSYNVKPQNNNNVTPVVVPGSIAIGSGTVTTVTTLSNGQTAHNATVTGSPLRIGGKVLITQAAAFANGVACDASMTSAGQLIQKQFASAENDWQKEAVAGGLTTTTVQELKAGTANLRTYLTGVTISATALTTATELVIREGSAGTILFRIPIPVAGLNTKQINFPTPIRTAAINTAISAQLLTSPVTGGVYVNAQGYVSA